MSDTPIHTRPRKGNGWRPTATRLPTDCPTSCLKLGVHGPRSLHDGILIARFTISDAKLYEEGVSYGGIDVF